MSWAEVKNLKDKLTSLANNTLLIKTGAQYAGKEVLVKRYDRDYLKVTLDSQASASVEVSPKAQYEVVINDGSNVTSGVFSVGTGEHKSVDFGYIVDGSTVAPLDDVFTWLKCANLHTVYPSYDAFEKIAVDPTCRTALLHNENACKYLARSYATLLTKVLDHEKTRNSFRDSKYASYYCINNTDARLKLYAHTHLLSACNVYKRDINANMLNADGSIPQYYADELGKLVINKITWVSGDVWKLVDGIVEQQGIGSEGNNITNGVVEFEVVFDRFVFINYLKQVCDPTYGGIATFKYYDEKTSTWNTITNTEASGGTAVYKATDKGIRTKIVRVYLCGNVATNSFWYVRPYEFYYNAVADLVQA